jgi:hypothetical protein
MPTRNSADYLRKTTAEVFCDVKLVVEAHGVG